MAAHRPEVRPPAPESNRPERLQDGATFPGGTDRRPVFGNDGGLRRVEQLQRKRQDGLVKLFLILDAAERFGGDLDHAPLRRLDRSDLPGRGRRR